MVKEDLLWLIKSSVCFKLVTNVISLMNIVRQVTSEDVRGFLFASTEQQPKSTTLVRIPMVSELAEQSINAKPIWKKRGFSKSTTAVKAATG